MLELSILPVAECLAPQLKARIKSYLLFYFCVSNEGRPEERETVIASVDVVLRGFGEPSQFRSAICTFAFLRWNVRHSVVRFARRARRFCSDSRRAGAWQCNALRV